MRTQKAQLLATEFEREGGFSNLESIDVGCLDSHVYLPVAVEYLDEVDFTWREYRSQAFPPHIEIEKAYEEDNKIRAKDDLDVETRRLFSGEPSPIPYPDEWRGEVDQYRESEGLDQPEEPINELNELLAAARIDELPIEKPSRKRRARVGDVHFDNYIDESALPELPDPEFPLLSELESLFTEAAVSGDYRAFIDRLETIIVYDRDEKIIPIWEQEEIPTPTEKLTDRQEYYLHRFWSSFNRERYLELVPEPEIDQQNSVDLEKKLQPKYLVYGTEYEDKVSIHPFDAWMNPEEYLALLQNRMIGEGTFVSLKDKIVFREHRDAVRFAADEREVQSLAVRFYRDHIFSSRGKNDNALEELCEFYEPKPKPKQDHPHVKELEALKILMYKRGNGTGGGIGVKQKPSLGAGRVELSANQARANELHRIIDANKAFYLGVTTHHSDDEVLVERRKSSDSSVRTRAQHVPPAVKGYSNGPVNSELRPKIHTSFRPVFI